jgi:8-oxoguanine deaminase
MNTAASTPASFLLRNPAAVMTGAAGPTATGGTAAAMPGSAAPRVSGDIRVVDGLIQSIGALQPLPGEQVYDATDCVVYPGWVNTHHHLFQALLKGVPAGINVPLMQWLAAVPVRYRRFINEDTLRLAATIGIAELVLSGCTTVADHNYAYWPGMGFDGSAVVFDVAERLGVRLALLRGGATRVRDVDAAAPPQAQPETLDGLLAAVERDVGRFHDDGPSAMRKVMIAPSSPTWSVHPHELTELARAARRMRIKLHTHLSETADYVRYCRELHGCLPVEFVAQHEWLGPDVWFAHMVHVSEAEIPLLAESGTGVAHCPQSNCRLGSGIAPVPEFHRAGVPVSLGVDGTASNEAGDMVNEAHVCWFVHRARGGAAAATVEDVVHWGTEAGARLMGFGGTGTVAPGRAADLAVYSLEQLRYAGLHDPAIGPVVCGGGAHLKYVFCAGRLIAEDGRIPSLDIPRVLAQARQAIAAMVC